jgi:hypothetical protein
MRKRWEYLVVADFGDKVRSPQQGLNDMGRDGWELVLSRRASAYDGIEYIFKREVEQ